MFENKKAYELNCEQIAELLNYENGKNYSESTYRKEYAAFSRGRNYERDINLEDEISVRLRELKKERVKLQTEKIEYNKWIRENARDELFVEKIIDAIRENNEKLPPIEKIEVVPNKKHGILNLADIHFGKDFIIYGLKNEVINQYNPEICYQRMENILNETVSIVKKEGLTHIKVINLGDALDGFLRHKQLWTLRYGVVDSANIFGKYLGKWLRKLSEYVNVEYHQTGGNHGELRLLDGIKDAHVNENIEKIIAGYIDVINEDNPNFTLVENKTGLIFTNIAGFNILGIHGQVKNAEKAIKDYADFYKVNIDYLLKGHFHHDSYMNCGIRKGIVGVGSVIGVDDFSTSLIKHSDATATFLLFEEEKGLITRQTIVLN